MYNHEIPFPEVPFKFSHPISQDAMKEAGCFTTFGARVNVADDLANAGCKRAVEDYAKTLNPAISNRPPPTVSPVGCMSSLAYPEILPQRAELVAHTTDLGFLHDEYTDNNIAALGPFHGCLDCALDPDKTENPDGSAKALLMKKIFSIDILECLEIDLQPGLRLFKSYSEQWLKVVDYREDRNFSTFDEYLEHRIRDSGALVAIWQIAFGMGIHLSDEEYRMMEPSI